MVPSCAKCVQIPTVVWSRYGKKYLKYAGALRSIVVHSYRHGWGAESNRSCEPFLAHMVKGRLSTESHSVLLRRVNLYLFLGYNVVTDWMPAFISLIVVRNSAADHLFLPMVVLWRCRILNSQRLLHWWKLLLWAKALMHHLLPEQGTLRHHNTPSWHAVACLDPYWSFCIAIKIVFIFHHNEQDGLLHSLRHVPLLLFLIVCWSSFLVREGLRQWQPSEK